MTVQDLIDELSTCNPKSAVTFSMAIDTSDDPTERWFAEDGVECIHDNGHPEFGKDNATEVTICLVGVSNLSSS